MLVRGLYSNLVCHLQLACVTLSKTLIIVYDIFTCYGVIAVVVLYLESVLFCCILVRTRMFRNINVLFR